MLASWFHDARVRTLALVSDLDDAQLVGPPLASVNPLLWELGHVGWFQERWVLRHGFGRAPLRADGDAIWDSSAIARPGRWRVPLPDRAATLAFLWEVLDGVLEVLPGASRSRRLRQLVLLALFHEDMHGEALAHTRQAQGLPAPPPHPPPPGAAPAPAAAPATPPRGDVELPGGTFWLGARPDEPFVFDNEKWAHPVEVAPFALARAPVTQGELRAFVEEGGYVRRELWSGEGWRWREETGARGPLYWRREGRQVLRRHFDRWVPLEEDLPAVHVCHHEAEAFCRWVGRRLPTEAEWELAATAGAGGGATASRKRRFPWGDEPPTQGRALLDAARIGCAPAGAYPAGDGASGCRQLVGNVWEWTSSDFLPYPGFSADAYRDYSAPWFGREKVLRGGSWATRSRLIRASYRNFFPAGRRVVFAGLRTARSLS